MDKATRRRLTLGFISNWVSRLAGTVIQLAQVPLFLHFWGKSLYGEWMIVSAIPAYLAFSSIGFGNVAANEMTMFMGRGDRESTLRSFQSCWWLISVACVAIMAVAGVAMQFLPIARLANLSLITDTDARWMLFALGFAVLFGQLEQLLGGAYTCIGRYPYGNFVKSMLNLVGYGIMFIPVAMGKGPRTTAIVFGLDNVAQTVILMLFVKHDMPWIRFGWRYASWNEIRRMVTPAFAFMGFPMGNALNLQGTLLAVGRTLGHDDIVIFGTARTVSRVALQMVQMVSQTFSPEMAAAFGAENIALMRTLHRRACQAALIVGVVLLIGVFTVGPWFLANWTLHQLPPGRTLLLLLMVSVLFYAGWSTSATLLTATNRHKRLAAAYVAATAVTVVITYFAAKFSGLPAAAASLIVSEIAMNFVVLPQSLHMAKDTFAGFAAAMFAFPDALRPEAIRRRLGRAKPVSPEVDQVEGV